MSISKHLKYPLVSEHRHTNLVFKIWAAWLHLLDYNNTIKMETKIHL